MSVPPLRARIKRYFLGDKTIKWGDCNQVALSIYRRGVATGLTKIEAYKAYRTHMLTHDHLPIPREKIKAYIP